MKECGKLPKIDILIIAYNQQDSISRAIDSILAQETEFFYRINIADDFSTDRTREILIAYHKKYPDIINLILSDQNLGAKKNFIKGANYLIGEYIACLDGDDYWCDKSKLQKQISFLEQQLNFVGCAHNTLMISASKQENKIRHKIKDIYTIRDFMDGSASFHSSSLVFRNVFHGKIPDSQKDQKAEDLFFLILHAQYGKIKYIDEVMSAYRLHGKGEWSSLDEEEKLRKTVSLMKFVADNFVDKKYKYYAKYGIKRSLKNLYKKCILVKRQSMFLFVKSYVKFRLLCYSIKIYELRKKYENG